MDADHLPCTHVVVQLATNVEVGSLYVHCVGGSAESRLSFLKCQQLCTNAVSFTDFFSLLWHQ